MSEEKRVVDNNGELDDEFYLLSEDGRLVKGHVLFTFENEETNKCYVAYTDESYADDGSMRAYAAVYHPEDISKGFEPIQTDAEWKVVETVLETIQEAVSLNKFKYGRGYDVYEESV